MSDPKAIKAELARLRAKRTEVQDKDIALALDERIAALVAQLPAKGAETSSSPEQKAQNEHEALRKSLKSDLGRFRVKRSETQDKDLRTALDAQIKELEAKLAAIPEEPVEEFVNAEPPTPAQAAEAENLVRQARVEKMRGNARGATEMLKKASEVAPGSPVVLETLGDDLVERRQFPPAKDAYFRAWKLDPKNVGLERKYAMIVAQMDATGSLDDQMRANLSDFGGSAESYGSVLAATLLSLFLPGLGHVAVLQKKVGYVIIGAWLICGAWVFLMWEDVLRLSGPITGVRGNPNMTVLLPIMLMLAIYVGTIASLKTARKQYTRKVVDRPVPLVDLPFELDENAEPRKRPRVS